MKYSIVIPTLTNTLDHANILYKCIETIRENSGDSKDYELIIVNDGSPLNIEPTTFNADMYIRRRENKGIATSWNDGIKIARGEYIAIVNDDITVQKGWLEALSNALDFDEDYFVSAPAVQGQTYGIGIEENHDWFPGYCFMLKRETIDTMGLFDEQFTPFNYEDTDYWTRVLKSGKKLVRNYTTEITHIGGDVLHKLKYDEVSTINKEKFVKKHGFDPIPVFYEGAPLPWENS